eukprot:2370848-Amphidinium_carterae.1
MDDNEDKQQTLRLCSETETDDVTIAMLKMNIKLPTPTMYDGKSPEVKSYLTVHNIYIDDLLEDSV